MTTTELNLVGRLREVEARFREVEARLSDPAVISDPAELRHQSKLHNDLGKVVTKYHELTETESRLAEARELSGDPDPEIAQLARIEMEQLEQDRARLMRDLQVLLLPQDPLDERNTIVEIRAGTGGEEAALFAYDLLRMYTKYAERQGWRVEILSSSETGLNGLKEVIFSVEGERVYSRLKYEAGTHRVQRVPETEAQGRIHTSAATVAVLPEAEEVDIVIRPEDLRIDVFRSGGPGGQSVNTTDSAVRVTHLPTNLVVSCQDEKSQHKNKAKALKVLRARLLELETTRQQAEIAATRRKMVGTGDRSERIRTYNFPQNRLTDHRINLTLYSLDRIMEGDLDAVIEPLMLEDQTRRLQNLE
ncbi:MAG: peptide chain release factor 1 [Candidatus Sumerlaeaceae bacterium]|nr:peptide chain release factor 1 [Candidatus Sumerlaeaceae bacterium]